LEKESPQKQVVEDNFDELWDLLDDAAGDDTPAAFGNMMYREAVLHTIEEQDEASHVGQNAEIEKDGLKSSKRLSGLGPNPMVLNNRETTTVAVVGTNPVPGSTAVQSSGEGGTDPNLTENRTQTKIS